MIRRVTGPGTEVPMRAPLTLETGHTQRLVEAYVDCDGDALLLKVDQTGPACHTGEAVCFYRKLG